jgi:PTS system fructose-specific IIC component
MMEIVVALIAFEKGLITAQVFIAIVFSAVFSSVIMGPWMRQAMARRAGVCIGQYLVETAVEADLAAVDRPAAINSLAVRAAAAVDGSLAGRIAGAALAREKEFGTAVGSGVAIPHARLGEIPRPLLAFGRVPDGIDWDAPDGEPVRYVFFLATPSGAQDTHV